MRQAPDGSAARRPQLVLVTGGHLAGDESPDCLFVSGEVTWLDAPRLSVGHTHGSGCVLSAAVCAGLAKGMDPADACVAAKRFTERAIAAGLPLGSGPGPVDPGWDRYVSGEREASWRGSATQ